MKYLLLLLLPLTTYAGLFDLPESETDPESEEVLIKKPEKYLRNESMIYDLNTNLGIKDQRQYTGSDRNRFSLAAHLSGDYEHFTDILGLEVNMMRRSTRYNQFWYGAQFFQHKTYFDAITQNHSANATPGSEGSFQRPGNVKNNVLGLGLGVGYRFKLLMDFYPTEDVFETVDVFVNAIQLDESFIDETYRGYGLSANYGLHKRSSTSFVYGGKFSYNVASVTRPKRENEKKTDRSLALGWLSLAFEIGWFY